MRSTSSHNTLFNLLELYILCPMIWMPNFNSILVMLPIFIPLPSHSSRFLFSSLGWPRDFLYLAFVIMERLLILWIIFFVIKSGCSSHSFPLCIQLRINLIHFSWKLEGMLWIWVNPLALRCWCSGFKPPLMHNLSRVSSISRVLISWIIHLKWEWMSLINNSLERI